MGTKLYIVLVAAGSRTQISGVSFPQIIHICEQKGRWDIPIVPLWGQGAFWNVYVGKL